jgi:hypothetical protein
MAAIAKLGTRIELMPMDPHLGDISIGLYEQEQAQGTVALVHSYSSREGVAERLDAVVEAMVALGGLTRVSDGGRLVAYPCGSWHRAAARRAFLEACKLPPDSVPTPRPLEAEDGRSGRRLRVEGLGAGRYRVGADGAANESSGRASAVARGLAKLAELETEGDTSVAFGCGRDHDAIIGLLLVRALNLRATLRDEVAVSSRGVLAAPSAQEQA